MAAKDANSPVTLPPAVWIALVLSLAGAFALHQKPFQDPRPPDPTANLYRHVPADDQDVEARLWEDPLAAVSIARDAHELDEAAPAVPKPLSSEPASHHPGHSAQASAQCEGDGAGSPGRHTIAELHAEVCFVVMGGGRVLVLAAMVPGAPYAEDVETRRRTRYAVLAGLYRANFVPDNSEHIGYISLADFYSDPAHGRDFAAYEWLQWEPPRESPTEKNQRDLSTSMKTMPAPQVLLLWLDQDGFREGPLRTLTRIVNSLMALPSGTPASASTVATDVLGPVDSDGLREMSEDLYSRTDKKCITSPSPEDLRPMAIFSPRATAPDENLVGKLDEGESLAERFHHCSHHLVQLYRSVATDRLLSNLLRQELRYRGVKDSGEIALIAERDTLYGRQMGDYFGGCAQPPTAISPGGVPQTDSPHPLCFTYLRGLDGLAPPAPATTGSASTAHATSSAAVTTQSTQQPSVSEVASGQGQLDYLRRLATSLASGGKGVDELPHHIKAIGILGSDVYDKLLILQALRSSFPRATFFTTDLDGRLLDQQSLQWTQQLLVASSLGLALRPCLQDGIPPFRDTYQSATYFATVLAVHQWLPATESSAAASSFADPCPPAAASSDADGSAPADSEDTKPHGLQWTQHPRIYEIGRTKSFDLTFDKEAKAPCDLDGLCDSIAAAEPFNFLSNPSPRYGFELGLALSLIAIAVVWAGMGTRWVLDTAIGTATKASPNVSLPSRRVWLAGPLVVLILVSPLIWQWLVHAFTNGETRVPAAVLSGASVWAADLVEILSILAVVTLVIRGQRKLSENADKIQREFGFENSRVDLVGDRMRHVRTWSAVSRAMESLWLPIWGLSIDEGPLLTTDKVSEIEALFARYLYRGTAAARLLRVGLATFTATAALIFLEFWFERSLVGGADLFHAESVESRLTNGISLLSLVSMLFLILWVADAMMLSRSFLLELLSRKPKWPDVVFQKAMREVALPAEQLALWLDLRLISARTAWVTHLIWYPSLVILVMTLAAFTVEFGQFGLANNPLSILISVALVITSAVLLRKAAELWREAVTENINDERLRDFAPGASAGKEGTQLDRLLERVNELSTGAFAPFSAQPFVRAVLVPLITYGATAAVAYFHIS